MMWVLWNFHFSESVLHDEIMSIDQNDPGQIYIVPQCMKVERMGTIVLGSFLEWLLPPASYAVHFLFSPPNFQGRLAVMWCLEALPRLEAASRQNFHCLGLGLGLD